MEYITFAIVFFLVATVSMQVSKKYELCDRINELEIELFEEQDKNKILLQTKHNLEITNLSFKNSLEELTKELNRTKQDHRKDCHDFANNLREVITKFLTGNLYAIPATSDDPSIARPGTGSKCDAS
jgi:hypothetical protein